MLLVTGANGYIGKALIDEAISHGYKVRGVVRNPKLVTNIKQKEIVQVPSLDGNTDWLRELESCETVIHLAAMAHNYTGLKSEELDNYMKINCEATVNLAHQSHKKGIKRFIFLSSTGVMGPQVTNGFPYCPESNPKPHDSYTRSKAYAEQELIKLSNKSSMEIIILRAPVVYGPNAPGSIGSLSKAIKLGIPLPLGGLFNRRHLISINNLVELLLVCISSPNLANGVFIASDDEAISTTDLCYLCGQYVGRRPRLISMSPRILMIIASLIGKQKKISTLLGDLELDSSKTNSHLKWLPRYKPSKHIFNIKNNINSNNKTDEF